MILNNPHADRIKNIAALAGRSARRKSGFFLVEGPQSVRELIAHAPDRVSDVYFSTAVIDRYREIFDAAHRAELYVHETTPDVALKLSPDAQGIVAVARMENSVLADVPAASPLVAVLSNVRDPGNAGTAIRVADAAGAGAIVLAGETVDPHNPKVARSTAGSLFHLPVIHKVTLEETVDRLREQGFTVLAADGVGTVTLGDASFTLPRKTAWLFGNEAWGLSDDERDLADEVVRIPIFGKAESLNLATAVSVCLYASALN